jgi:hypothetical protein
MAWVPRSSPPASERGGGGGGARLTVATALLDVDPDQAYIQNHPLVMPVRDWAYDAVNEVYFDDVDGLLARMGTSGRTSPRPRKTISLARAGS